MLGKLWTTGLVWVFGFIVGGALCRAGGVKVHRRRAARSGLRLIVYPAFFSEDARGILPPTGIKKPCDINCKAFKLLEPDTFTNTQTL